MFATTPLALAKCAARALLNSLGFDEVSTELVVEVVPSMCDDLWKKWRKERTPEERLLDLEELANASAADVRSAVREITAEIVDPKKRAIVEGYIAAMPGSLRASMRRPADPTGRTVPAELVLGCAEDLAQLLPNRLPRFQPGDTPQGIGDWELVELLGTGGFGEVWKAKHKVIGKLAALKFCLDPDARKTLDHEAKLLVHINEALRKSKNQGIVHLRNTYLNADPACLEYAYVEGGTLSRLITEWHAGKSKPTPEVVARLILNLAEIMQKHHALDQPIVHRDLKPANILVQQKEGQAPRLLITDFGLGAVAMQLAKAAELGRGSIPLHSLAIAHGSHTPLYASPEQIRGARPDPRDDVHAIGVIWWQILRGDVQQGAPTGTWMRRLTETKVPGEMVELLAECLESERDFRLKDAGALVERLKRCLGLQKRADTLKASSPFAPLGTKPAALPKAPMRPASPIPPLKKTLDQEKAGALNLFDEQEKMEQARKDRRAEAGASPPLSILPPIHLLKQSASKESKLPPVEEGGNSKVIHLKPPITVSQLAAGTNLKVFQVVKDLVEHKVWAKSDTVVEPGIAAKICKQHGFALARDTH